MMLDFNIFSIASLLALFLNTIFFFFLFFEARNKESDDCEQVRNYLLLIISMIIWQAVEFINRLVFPFDYSVLSWKISTASTLFIGYFFYLFVLSLTKKKESKTSKILTFSSATVIVALIFFSNLIVAGVTEKFVWGRYVAYGQLAVLYYFFMTGYFVLAALLVVGAIKRESNLARKRALMIMLGAHSSVFVLGTITDVVFPLFGKNILPIGSALSVVPVTLTVFSVLKRSHLRFGKNYFSIAGKLVLSTILIVLLTTCVISLAVFSKSSSSIKEGVYTRLNGILDLKESKLDNFLLEEKTKLDAIVKNEQLLTLLGQANNFSENSSLPSVNLGAYLDKIQKENSKYFYYLKVIDDKGRVLFASGKEGIGDIVPIDDYLINNDASLYYRYFYAKGDDVKNKVTIASPLTVNGEDLFFVADLNVEKISDIMKDDLGLGKTGETYLLNQDYYLVTDSKYDYDAKYKKKIETEASSLCMQRVNGHGIYRDYRGVEVIGVYRWLALQDVCMLAEIDSEEALFEMANLKDVFFLVGIFVVFISAILSIIVARTITRPIDKLLLGVKRLASGKFGEEVKVNTKDELKILADAFNKAGQEIQRAKEKEDAYSEELKSEVSKKTKTLHEMIKKMKVDQENLRNQRLAISNILEDVTESQRKIKAANIQLENKRDELLALKNLSDDLTSVISVDEAIKVANKFLDKFFNYNVNSFFMLNPVEKGSIAFYSFLNTEINESFVVETKKELLKTVEQYKDKENSSSIKLLKYIKPKYLGEKLNNELGFVPKKIDYFPLVIGKKFLGIIQASAKDDFQTGEEERGLIDAFLNTLAFSLERIQSLLLAQHSKTISLVESLSNGVLMFDNNQEVVLFNPAVKEFLPNIEANQDLEFVAKKLSISDLQEIVKKVFEKGKVSKITEVEIDKRFLEMYVTPVKDNDGKIVGGALIFHDITYLKEIDQMKTEFVSVASHQLRTPLTAIKLFSNMLKDGEVGELNEQQMEYIANIKESTDRMVLLVNDLLNVTRIESGRLRVESVPTNLHEFIEDIVKEAGTLATEKGQELDFSDETKDLPLIPLDVNLFRQVVHNLLVNAIRYSPEKKGKVQIRIYQEKSSVFTISVKDNGIGIPEESHGRIFEKFYRANNAVKAITEGTGLGLYVSRMVVELSGGRIWFESASGKGSTFFIELPVKGMQNKEGERGLMLS